MAFQVECRKCKKSFLVTNDRAGIRIKCPKCGHHFQVRRPSEPSKDTSSLVRAVAPPGDRWFVCDAEGKQYGPIDKPELDMWVTEGRLTAECQVLREGDAQWQWAPAVYPNLKTDDNPLAATDMETTSEYVETFPDIDSPSVDSSDDRAISPKPKTSDFQSRYRHAARERFRPSTSLLDIFDWKFEKYLTPWIVRATWIAVLVLSALWIVLLSGGLLVSLAPTLPETEGTNQNWRGSEPEFGFQPRRSPIPLWAVSRILAVAGYLTGLMMLAITLLWVRVVLEMTIVMFNIANTLSTIESNTLPSHL